MGWRFYPGESRIDMAFNKNIKPVMYLIENADNPYKVLNSDSAFNLYRTSVLI